MRILYSNQFKKDYKRVKKQQKKLEKLQIVIKKLASRKPLEEKYRDHRLSGEWLGFRDCHINR